MKKIFLLIVLAGALLTSCKKCKDCEVKVEVLSTSSMDDAACAAASQATGGTATTCQEYFDDLYSVTANVNINITFYYFFPEFNNITFICN